MLSAIARNRSHRQNNPVQISLTEPVSRILFGEIEILLPIVAGHIVRAVPKMVAHIVADKGFFYDEVVERRQFSGAVEAVYFRRFRKPRQLAFGIGPKSLLALATYSARGATHASIWCWSMGSSPSLSRYLFRFLENQNGKSVVMCFTDSPNLRRDKAAPMCPGLFASTSAKRLS